MDQELLKRIIVALYKRLCAGSLLIIVPELPWGQEPLVRLTQCLAAFGWQTDMVLAPGCPAFQPASGRIIEKTEALDWSGYQKIWVPAMPLNVLSRLRTLSPGNREEAMILEALMSGIPVGSPDQSWLPPQIRNRTGGSADLNHQTQELSGILTAWGMCWVPEEASGSWVLGAGTSQGYSVWTESVLHGSGVRLLGPEVQTLKIQKGTVVTAAARDELSRRGIRLIGDR